MFFEDFMLHMLGLGNRISVSLEVNSRKYGSDLVLSDLCFVADHGREREITSP